MKKNIWYAIGILAGVAAIIIGIVFLVDTYGTYIGQSYTFGADFYTEMYSVTKNIGSAINNAYVGIMQGFGWLFILGGLVDVCVFGSKLERKKRTLQKADVPEEAQ